MLQTKGILTTWKEDKGFGFIRPDSGGRDVFVHIRDFGDIPRMPRVGDVVYYQPVSDQSGKYRAGDVRIEGVPRRTTSLIRTDVRPKKARERGALGKFFLPLGAVGVLAAVYFGKGPEILGQAQAIYTPQLNGVAPTQFKCEGKQYCSEMTSCEEAEFYIKSCPDTKMDGDGDGIPCESQWCG